MVTTTSLNCAHVPTILDFAVIANLVLQNCQAEASKTARQVPHPLELRSVYSGYLQQHLLLSIPLTPDMRCTVGF